MSGFISRQKTMNKAFGFFFLLLLSGCPGVVHAADRFADEPEYRGEATLPWKTAATYRDALQTWKTAEDIHAWIATHFSYDRSRAVQLSETQRKKNGGLEIYDPAALFESKTGACVDLARFGFETLRSIDPHSDPKYLVIEFDPVQIQGNTYRLHWLVSFRRYGQSYFFADSQRPGYIAGPYRDTQAFIKEYEEYRSRRIVAFRELESYKKERSRDKKLKKRAIGRGHNDEFKRGLPARHEN